MQFEPPNALFPPLPADLEFGTYFVRSLLSPFFIVILGRRRKVYRNKVRHFCFLFPLYVLAATLLFTPRGKIIVHQTFFLAWHFLSFACVFVSFFISLFSTAFASLRMLGTKFSSQLLLLSPCKVNLCVCRYFPLKRYEHIIPFIFHSFAQVLQFLMLLNWQRKLRSFIA